MLKQKFANNLKKIRKSRKFTQEQLAEMVGVDFRYISFIENAKNFPSSYLIEKLADALNVGCEEFFSVEENIDRTKMEKDIIELLKHLNDGHLKIIYKLIKDLTFIK